MRSTWTNVGELNSSVSYLASVILISPNFFCPPKESCSLHLMNIGVDDFSFLVGTRVEEETNELCVVQQMRNRNSNI